MNRPLKTIIVLAALAVFVLAATVSPAAAKSKPACWKVLINDWYDGKITGKYAPHCYREALGHLSSDLEGYTSARDDIRRALNQRLAEIAAAKKHTATKAKKGKTTPPQSSGGNNNTSGPAGPSGPSNPPTKPSPPAVVAPKSNNGGKAKHKVTNPTTKPHSPKAGSPAPVIKQVTPSTPTPGRDKSKGPAQVLINKLGPDDATSLPIPLIVLAGIAALLMTAGAVSLIAKRAQARRVTVPVRSAQSR